jgi:hypothetical protein
MESDFFKALNQHKQKSLELAKSLENLPVRCEVFSVDKINTLIEIRKVISRMQTIEEVEAYLDSQNIWKTKFSTGGRVDKDKDSIYYVTDDNISLRLKKADIDRGLQSVIQPYMENIVFLEGGSSGVFYPSENPILESTPSEYCSQEFYNLQNTNAVEDFISQVPKFYKDDKLYYVGKPKNLYHEHPGSEVSQVFFIKQIS